MGWHRLANEVIRRRVELGHDTRASFIAESGLGARTVGDIETARRTSYDPATLARLEQALQWEPETVRQHLAADDPSPIDMSQLPRRGVPDGGREFVTLADGTIIAYQVDQRPQIVERTTRYKRIPIGHELGELLTPEGLARYLHRDDLVLVELLHRSGLDEGALFRLILRIRARREQQNAELLAEVADLVREAGGHAPDPAYPPTWLFDGSDPAG